ncbi:MAG: glycosyltransferase [Candidatus Omnitrophota bacterium]|nr:glycosyltransferase [Candidatus Omnitrophota bacterium]
MRIAFFVYPWAMQSPGGGEILLLKTKETLEKKGISVTFFNQWEHKLKNFDILHVFGSVKDCLGLMRAAKSAGTKVVLSPIFWSTFNRALNEYGSFTQKTIGALRHLAKVLVPIMPSARREMFLVADALLPNSKAELEQVSRLFAINKQKMHIVYLGIDEKFYNADPREFINKYKIKDFVLSVGRIEPRKNQLNLIKALKGSGKQLVFIGDPVIGYENYYELCRRSAEDAIFINRLQHSDSLFSSAYAACSVFVLQGWFETPGLVALEAGLAGAKLALTMGGSTKEYFKNYAEYFNPANPASIRKAIDLVLTKDKTKDLQRYLFDNFLWLKTTEENIKVYRRITS